MSDEIAFVVPGRLTQLTGGYLFARHIVEGLRARGRVVRVIELSARDPEAGSAALAALAAVFRRLPLPVIGRIEDQSLVLDLRCLENEKGFAENLAKLALSETADVRA